MAFSRKKCHLCFSWRTLSQWEWLYLPFRRNLRNLNREGGGNVGSIDFDYAKKISLRLILNVGVESSINNFNHIWTNSPFTNTQIDIVRTGEKLFPTLFLCVFWIILHKTFCCRALKDIHIKNLVSVASREWKFLFLMELYCITATRKN